MSRYNAERMPIRRPMLYLNTRPFYESKDKTKAKVSKIIKTVFPKYKQRLRTMDLISELINTQEDLERKVELLEEKLAEKSNEK